MLLSEYLSEQVYGNIQVKLEKLKESNQTELLEAVTRLIETIKDSDIDDEVKREQVDNIDYLIAESEKPPENRNRGVIKSVETSLSIKLQQIRKRDFTGAVDRGCL